MNAMNTLVVRPGALGDAILTLPLLARLKRDYGGTIIVLGTPASWTFMNPSLDIRVMDFGSPIWLGFFDAAVPLSHEAVTILETVEHAFVYLRSTCLDFDLRMLYGVKTASRSEPPISSEQNAGEVLQQTEVRRWPMDKLPPVHAVKTLGAAGTELIEDWIETRREQQAVADDLLNRLRVKHNVTRFVAIHPGSGGKRKCWATESFAQLAVRIYSELNCLPLVTFGPADETVRVKFLAAMPSGIPWHALDSCPLREVLALLRQCELAITNDSGVGHLAARATKTLAIFGPSDPNVWAPVGEDVTTIQAARGDLSALSVDEVFAVAAQKLSVK